MNWQVKELHPSGIKTIQLAVHQDNRGLFVETIRHDIFQVALGQEAQFVQSNLSISHKNVLRGLHFQVNHPQGKLIHVLHGTILDVAIDIRPQSPFFGQHQRIVLKADEYQQLWLPPGFAHGFVTLSEKAQVMYHCTEYYFPEDQGCLKWNDLSLNIDWSIDKPILSQKDQQGLSWPEWRAKLMQIANTLDTK